MFVACREGCCAARTTPPTHAMLMRATRRRAGEQQTITMRQQALRRASPLAAVLSPRRFKTYRYTLSRRDMPPPLPPSRSAQILIFHAAPPRYGVARAIAFNRCRRLFIPLIIRTGDRYDRSDTR